MKQFNTRHWIVVSTILIVSVFISLFYWFQFRPASIRIICQKQVDERMFTIKQIASSSSLSLSDIIWSKKHGFSVYKEMYTKESPIRQKWLKKYGFEASPKPSQVVEQSQINQNKIIEKQPQGKTDAFSRDTELDDLLGTNEIFTEEEKQTFYQECLQRHGLNQ